GGQTYCDAITRGTAPGGAQIIEQIRLQPFNFAVLRARGLDFEASYRMPVDTIFSGSGGELQFRALMTRYLERFEDEGVAAPTDSAGSNGGNGPPEYIYRTSIAYINNPLNITLTGRGVSDGTYSNSFIGCTSGCPASTADN